ncbi:MAG: hypothetical protein N3B21_14360 [Clostridia bacterium]|nr:hypothetical protein [Clostridia bacterium]
MNKKLVTMGVSIAVGSVMLFTTAFASMTTATGYETYKSALKSTAAVKNFTGDFELTVKDNGKTLIDIDSALKADCEKELMSNSTIVKSDTEEKRMEMYGQDKKAIIKTDDSEVYNIISTEHDKKFKHGRANKENMNPEEIEAVEKVVDALVGNLQNYVTASNKADDEKEVSVQLSGNQIPAVVNALASLGIKYGHDEERISSRHKNNSPFNHDIKVNAPKLVDDIRIDSVDMKAEINKENLIETQIVNIKVSGKDADGKNHDVDVAIKMALSDFNNTVPDSVDLTGKQVKTINPEDFKHRD